MKRTALVIRLLHVARVVRVARAVRTGCAACVVCGAASCWSGWSSIFDQTPSREHRVEDLRVLAVVAEPASLILPSTYAADANAAPVVLDVKPAIFDPRGGDIELNVSVCAQPSPFQPCVGEPTVSMPAVAQLVHADAAKPLGRADVDVRLSLNHTQVLALYEQAAATADGPTPITLAVVVDVARTFDGKRERESAVLSLDMQADLYDGGISATDRRARIERSGALDCGPAPPNCTPDGTPPEGDPCTVAIAPVCAAQPKANRRPHVDGVTFHVEAIGAGGAPDVARDGVVNVAASGTTIAPSFDFVAQSDSFQQRLDGANQGCPPGSPGSTGGLTCGQTEVLTSRMYIADGKFDLHVSNAPLTQPFPVNVAQGAAPLIVTFAPGTPAGTREPLLIVISDGRGGMDLATFTLVAQ